MFRVLRVNNSFVTRFMLIAVIAFANTFCKFLLLHISISISIYFIIMLITKDDWRFWVYSVACVSQGGKYCVRLSSSVTTVLISYRSLFKTNLMIIILFHVFMYLESNWFYILNKDCHFFKKGNFQLYFSLLLKWNLVYTDYIYM